MVSCRPKIWGGYPPGCIPMRTQSLSVATRLNPVMQPSHVIRVKYHTTLNFSRVPLPQVKPQILDAILFVYEVIAIGCEGIVWAGFDGLIFSKVGEHNIV